ncbi:MAG: hypothetical protein IIV03_00030 [Clostridia bacterium]|nr:hypothetical protein [Clostridia bacterium]
MKSLVMAAKSRDGKVALIGIVIGIIISCVGGYIFENRPVLCDVVCIGGALFSMVGAEQFCRLIIAYREQYGEE